MILVNAAIDKMGNTPLSAAVHSIIEISEKRHMKTKSSLEVASTTTTIASGTKTQVSSSISLRKNSKAHGYQHLEKTLDSNVDEAIQKIEFLLKTGATSKNMLQPKYQHKKVWLK